MAGKLLPDELWNEIADLFPQHQSPEGGRHPKEHRQVLTAILFVLKTGIAWEEPAAGGVRLFVQDVQTTHRRVVATRTVATPPRAAPGQVACGRPTGLVTGTGRLQFGEGTAGRTKTGPNQTDRGRSGSKRCLLTDATGVPLVVQLTAANRRDVNTLLPLVVNLPAVAGKPGAPKHKPATLIADKAFDDAALRALLRWLGIKPHIPKRGHSAYGLGKTLWFIERTLSWFHQFRRLRLRWDRKPNVHQAFLSLAASVICYRKWNNQI